MTKRARVLVGLVWGLLAILPLQGQAWKTRTDRPADYPRPPKTPERLFFLQRNLNANTIVYDLNFSEPGKLDSKKPLQVYWLRYEEGGKRAELSWVQRKFGFGYSARPLKDQPGVFEVELVAYDRRKLLLKPKPDGRYAAILPIAGKPAELTHIYVYADESGWWPDVKYVDLFGREVETGRPLRERFHD